MKRSTTAKDNGRDRTGAGRIRGAGWVLFTIGAAGEEMQRGDLRAQGSGGVRDDRSSQRHHSETPALPHPLTPSPPLTQSLAQSLTPSHSERLLSFRHE